MEKESNENAVRALYFNLLQSWNTNNAADFAACFTANGNAVGFDGSQMDGKDQIEKELSAIFKEHKVASYVGIVREVREIGAGVFILRAVAGMLPPGKSEIKPDVNTIQTLVAVTEKDDFKIAAYQNTPAAFHGRKEASEALTQELQKTADAL